MSDKKKENLFAKLAAQQNRSADAAVAVEAPPEATPSPALPPRVTQSSRQVAEKKPQPVGKRNDPDYCQFNTYIPKTLRRAVEKALLDKDGLDNSSLVESLLRKWLKSQGQAD